MEETLDADGDDDGEAIVTSSNVGLTVDASKYVL